MIPQKWPKRPIDFLILLLIFIGCAFSIMLYGTYRCRTPTFEDPLTNSIIDKYPWNRYIDGWGLLHFWFYGFLAYKFPTHWVEVIIIGFMWEIIEMYFRERPFYLAKCDAQVEQEKEGWWYGRWEDLVMNSFGVVFGLWMYNKRIHQGILVAILIGILILHLVLQKYRNKNISNDGSKI